MDRTIRLTFMLLGALVLANSARALTVSEAEYRLANRMDALFKNAIPSDARIVEITTGTRYEISVLLPAADAQNSTVKTGITYSASVDATSVTAEPATYLLRSEACQNPVITTAEFSFITPLNVKKQTAEIMRKLNVQGVLRTSGHLLTDGHCQSYWQQSIDLADESGLFAVLRFDISGRLQAFERFEKNQLRGLSKQEVAALNAETQIAVERNEPRVIAQVEAQELPIFPAQGEYLQMQIDGETWHCAGDDMKLIFDYIQLEFECAANGTNESFGFNVTKPVAGELRTDEADDGLIIWWRRGDVLYADRHADDRYRLRITRFTSQEISGEFSADLHLKQLPNARIREGRFRILPSAGFRITPP